MKTTPTPDLAPGEELVEPCPDCGRRVAYSDGRGYRHVDEPERGCFLHRGVLHLLTGSSSVRCGAPMAPRTGAPGWDLGSATVNPAAVTCPLCAVPWP